MAPDQLDDLRGIQLSGFDLQNVDLSFVDLSFASLIGCRLAGASFQGSRLDDANLSLSDLVKADMLQVSALRARFDEADLSSAMLMRSSLNRASFLQATLHSAILAYADLTGADFSGATLDYADLRGAISPPAKRVPINDLVSPWEEFRRIIPMVSLRSGAHLPRQSELKVVVLLCTMQAQEFLAHQLNSIATQTHPGWAIWASDNGSDDHTRAILEYYQGHWGEERLTIHDGPAVGRTASLLSLACRADIEADCFAYADPDDIWEADKLERALTWIKSVPEDMPALYVSRTLLIDAKNQHLGYSPRFTRAPSFRNALVQSIASGNTMVFNRAARDLLRAAGDDIEAVTPDWWAYMLVTGSGGEVHYDPYPTVRYRQHSKNHLGAHQSLAGDSLYVWLLLQGRLRGWLDANLSALARVQHLLTPENRLIIEELGLSRQMGMWGRLKGLAKSGVWRQSLLGDLGLLIGAIIRRL